MHVADSLTIGLPHSSSHVRTELAASTSEADDVRSAARGDVDAFGRLYRSHAERVHILARRLVGADMADEATQDVFVRAWSKLGSFRGDARFGTWLHRLAVNVMIRQTHAMRRREQRERELVPELPAQGQSDPHVRLDLDAALTAIDVVFRQLIVLHDMEGYSHEEIAVLLGIGVSASRMRLSRARKAMRELMSEAGYDR
jgi:RNA polymerase sigma factor (sigma-70 family)